MKKGNVNIFYSLENPEDISITKQSEAIPSNKEEAKSIINKDILAIITALSMLINSAHQNQYGNIDDYMYKCNNELQKLKLKNEYSKIYVKK